MTSELPKPGTNTRGRFITFEGGEGAGKSTQIKLLADRLDATGIRTLVTREPGGSPGAEIMRHVVLSGVGKLLGPATETLLFAAARSDHVQLVIAPALAQQVWVLCDRFADSTRAYQGHVGKVDKVLIDGLERVTIGDLKPDLTVILDVPVEIGLARAAERRGTGATDRFESEAIEFHRKLREAYRAIAAAEPERCVLIDAEGEPALVAGRIWTALRDRLLTPPAAAEAKTA